MNDEGKMTDGTSGYLSDSPPSDKGIDCWLVKCTIVILNLRILFCDVAFIVFFIVAFRKAAAVA